MKRRPDPPTKPLPLPLAGEGFETPSKPGWRVPAIAAWASFIGAIPILVSWLAGPPGATTRDGASITVLFFGAWLCASLPAAIAALLAGHAHGR